MHKKVTVIGAGPAGLAASRTLLREGVDFTLLDSRSFPREKGCAGGLTPRTRKTISQIFPEVKIDGFESYELSLSKITDGSVKHLVTLVSKKPIFTTVDRKEFDRTLLESVIDRGGEFVSSRVREVNKTGDAFVVRTEDGEFTSDYVIISAGVFGAKLIGLEPPCYSIVSHGYSSPTGRASIIFIQDGYLWSFPGESYNSVGGGTYPDCRQLPSYEEISTLLKKSFDEELILTGTPVPLFNSDLVLKLNNFENGVLFAGDSAGLVDNWIGAGIDFALDSGRQAALSIVEDGHKGKTANERYLERLFPIAKHLQIADAFRKSFNANLDEKLDLLKGRTAGKLLINYLSGYVKGPYRLTLKSLFTSGVKSRSTHN